MRSFEWGTKKIFSRNFFLSVIALLAVFALFSAVFTQEQTAASFSKTIKNADGSYTTKLFVPPKFGQQAFFDAGTISPKYDGFVRWNGRTLYLKVSSEFIQLGGETARSTDVFYRGFLDFDTSQIPDDANVSQVKLNLFVETPYSADFGFQTWSVTSFSGRQITNAYNSQQLFENISSFPKYAEGLQGTIAGNHVVILGAQAAADLQQQLNQDYFSIGLIGADEDQALFRFYSSAAIVPSLQKPSIEVTYTLPSRAVPGPVDVNALRFDLNTFEEIERPNEQPCERQENANIYCLDADQRLAYIHIERVNYVDENGAFKRIDRQIRPLDSAKKLAEAARQGIAAGVAQKLQARSNYDYEVEESDLKVYWKDDFTQEDTVRVEKGDFSLAFSASELLYSGNGNTQLIGSAGSNKGTDSVTGNRVKYSDVFAEGFDLEYRYGFSGISKTITIDSNKSVPVPNANLGLAPVLQLKEKLNLPNNLLLYVDGKPYKGSTITTSQQLTLNDASSGSPELYIPVAIAYASDAASDFDAEGKPTNNNSFINLTYTIEKQGSSIFLYTSVPYAWLTNENRVYPIAIDPIVNITTAASANDGYIDYNPDDITYSCNNNLNTVSAGYSSLFNPSVRRSFLKFSTSSIPDAAPILGVSLKLTGGLILNSGNPTIEARRLGTSNVDCAGTASTVYSNIGSGTLYMSTTGWNEAIGDTATVSLGSTAATDLDNQLPSDYFNIGLKAVAANEVSPASRWGWYSYDQNSQVAPTLVVNYDVTGAPAALSSLDANNLLHRNSRFGGAKVTWADATGEQGYIVYRSANNSIGPFTNASGTLAANTTSFDEIGLLDNTTYYYKVSTIGVLADTNSSVDANVTTDRSGPSLPQNFVVSSTAGASAHADLNWTASDDNSAANSYFGSNLIGYWRLDEESGSTAYDSSGSGNDGTLYYNASFTKGRIGNAITLDGVGDNIRITSSSAYNFDRTDSYTLSAWYKGTANGAALVSKMDSNPSYKGYDMFLQGGYVEAHLLDTEITNGIKEHGTLYKVNDNKWHHIAVTYNGSSAASGLKIYVDGLEETTVIDYNTLTLSPTTANARFSIGARSYCTDVACIEHQEIAGTIDEVMVFNTVLSATSIKNLYNIGTVKYALEKSTDSGSSFTPINGDSADFNGTTLPSDWTVTDTGSGSVTQSGMLNIIGTGTWGETAFTYNTALARAAGVTFEGDFNASDPTATYAMVGFKDNGAGVGFVDGVHAIFFSASGGGGIIHIYEDNNPRIPGGSWNGTTIYRWKIVLKDQGAYYYINDKLVYNSDYSTESNLKPYVTHTSVAIANYDNFKIIVPIDTNTFADTAATDGANPNTPTGLTVNNPATSSLNVSWTAPSDNGTDYNYLINAFDSYGNSFDVNSTDIQGYWKFEDGLGTTAYDSSLNGRDGNVEAGVVWTENGGLGSGAYVFNGTDIIRAGDINQALTDFSASLWVYWNDPSVTLKRPISNRDSTANNYGWEIRTNPANNVQLLLDFGTPAIASQASGIDANRWYHVAFTADRDGFQRLYVNGVLRDSDSIAIYDGNSLRSTNQPFQIGGIFGNGSHVGKIDDVAVWNRVLTAAEVEQIYRSGNYNYATVTSGLKQYLLDCESGGSCSSGANDGSDLDNVLAGTPTTITGLSPGTQYCFTVLSTDNADNNSTVSSQVCGTTAIDGPVLSADANTLFALGSNLGGVVLSWTNVAGEDGFKIERKVAGSSYFQIFATAADVLAFNDNNVGDNNSLVYRVRAFTGASNGPYSNDAAIIVPDRNSSVPAALTATGDASNNRVNLTFTSNEFGDYVGSETASATTGWCYGVTFAPATETGWNQDYWFTITNAIVGRYTSDFNYLSSISNTSFYTGLAYYGNADSTNNVFFSQDWTTLDVNKWIVSSNGATWTSCSGASPPASCGGAWTGKLLTDGECLGIATDGNYLYCNADLSGYTGTTSGSRSNVVTRYKINQTSITAAGYFKVADGNYGEGLEYSNGYLYAGIGSDITANTKIAVIDVTSWPAGTGEWDEAPYLVKTIDVSGQVADIEGIGGNKSNYIYAFNCSATTVYKYKLFDYFAAERSPNNGTTFDPVGSGDFNDFSGTTLPSNWTVTDTGAGSISATAGKLFGRGSGIFGETGITYNTALARISGTTFEGDFNSSAQVQVWAGFTDNSGAVNVLDGVHVINFINTQAQIYEDAILRSTVSSAIDINKNYHWKIVLKAKGAKYFINDVLLFDSNYSTEGDLKPYIGFFDSDLSTFDNIKVTVPVRTNSFSDTAATDTALPSAVTISSIGADSASQLTVNYGTATDAGTDYNFVVSSLDDFGNESNLVKNPGFENGTTGWTNITNGVIDLDSSTGGYSLSSGNGTDDYAFVQQNLSTISGTLGRTFRICVDLKKSDDDASRKVLIYVYTGEGSDSGWMNFGLPVPTSSWAKYCFTNVIVDQGGPGTNAITSIVFYRYLAASWGTSDTVYIDNVHFEEVKGATTTTGLHATQPYNVSGTGTGAGWGAASPRAVTGLSTNTQYCYTVQSKDAASNSSAASASSCKYTLAAVPSAPTVGNAQPTSLDVTINVNGNPAATEFAIQCSSANCSGNPWVQANGSLGASEIWQTNANWGTKTVTGLSGHTQYCFKVKSRNGDNTETALSSETCSSSVNSAPTIAVTAPNNTGISISQVNGDYNIVFEVQDAQDDDLNAQIWYSTSAGGKQNSLVSSLNLVTGACGQDPNFTTTKACSWLWNTTGINGTFYIDVNVWDSYAGDDIDSSDNSFEVDNTAPTVTLQGPSDTSTTNDVDPDFTAAPSETVSNCYLQVDDASNFLSQFSDLNGLDVGADCDYGGTEYTTNFSNGTTIYWRMKATDDTGNVGSYGTAFSFTVDTSGPDISIADLNGDTAAAYWDSTNDSGTDLNINGAEAGVTCKWDTTSKAYYDLLSNNCNAASGNFIRCDFGAITQTASATRYYACKDSLDNNTTVQSVSFGVDWTVPTTSDDSSTAIAAPTYTVTLTEADNVSNSTDTTSYYCKDTNNSCTPTTSIDNGGTASFDASNRGLNYLRYYSVDAAGNTQSTASKTININQLPGFTSATADIGNSNPTIKGGTSITITTVASDADATQTLKLVICKSTGVSGTDCDGGAPDTYCSSTGSASNPSCGWTAESDDTTHNWYAYIFNSLNEPAPGNYKTGSYTTDSTAPTVTLQTPADASSTNDVDPDFTANPSETVSNCYLQVDDASNFLSQFSDLNGLDVGADCDYGGTEYTTNFSNGTTIYWRMKATDDTGNVGSYGTAFSFTVDTSGPDISIADLNGDTAAAYWDSTNDSGTDLVINNGEAGVTCKWDTANVAYASLASNCTTTSQAATCDFGALTQAASYTRYYACADSLGNATSTQSVSFGVDWTVPTTSDDSSTAIAAPNYSVTITEADNVSAAAAITTSFCSYTANNCTPSTVIDNGGQVTFSDSNRGVNYLRYSSTDAAGNVQSTASKTININRLPVLTAADENVSGTIKCPADIKFTSTASDADSQTLKFYACKATDATSSGCSVGNGLCSDTSSSSNPTCQYSKAGDNDSHNWYVFLFDSLNEAAAANYISGSFTCDATAPGSFSIVSIEGDTTAPYADTINDSDANLLFTASDAGSTVSACRWYATDVNYSVGTGTACSFNSGTSQWRCDFTGISTNGQAINRYVSCVDGVGNGNSSANNLDVSFTTSWNAAPSITSIDLNVSSASLNKDIKVTAAGLTDPDNDNLNFYCSDTPPFDSGAQIAGAASFCSRTGISSAGYAGANCVGQGLNTEGTATVKCVAYDGEFYSGVVSDTYINENVAPFTQSDINKFWQKTDANVHFTCSTGTSAFTSVLIYTQAHWTTTPPSGVTINFNSAQLEVINSNVQLKSGIRDANLTITVNAGSSVNWSGYDYYAQKYPFEGKDIFVKYRTSSNGSSWGSWSSETTSFNSPIGTENQYIQFNVRFQDRSTASGSFYTMSLYDFKIHYSPPGGSGCPSGATRFRLDSNPASTISFNPTTYATDGFYTGTAGVDFNVFDVNFLFSKDGNFAIQFYSVSGAGNNEIPKTEYVLQEASIQPVTLSACPSVVDGTNIDLQWTAPSSNAGLHHYEIMVSVDGTNYNTLNEQNNADDNYFNYSYTSYAFDTTSFYSSYGFTGNCGDGWCTQGEFCPEDSFDCPKGYSCSNGCQATSGSVSITCGDSVCSVGENCAADDSACDARYNTSGAYWCVNGCVQKTEGYYAQGGSSSPDSSICGNGICNFGETSTNCAADCSQANIPTSDGFCEWFEAAGIDCVCNSNGTCNYNENPQSCSADCQSFASGSGSGCYVDGWCSGTETVSTCPQDCDGVVGSTCDNDGVCESTEDNTSCKNDCLKCGDNFCGQGEFCSYDNAACRASSTSGNGNYGNNYVCGNPETSQTGCRQVTSVTIVCGDSICSPGENCPDTLENQFCKQKFGSSFVCINGCVDAPSSDYLTGSSKFGADSGSTDGVYFYKVRTYDALGNYADSTAIQCFVDTQSPFKVPTDGRGINQQISSAWGDFNFTFPSGLFGADNNITIDANTNYRPFTRGTMLEAYDIELPSSTSFGATKPSLTLDINVAALNCYNALGSAPLYGCTASDINKVSMYFYDTNAGEWVKYPSTVNLTTLKVTADLNHLSQWGLGQDTNAPSLSSIAITDTSGYTNDSTPTLTISAGSDASHMAFSCNNSTFGSWIAFVSTYSSFDITTGAGCSTGDGTKTVYVKVKDSEGNESSTVNDSTVYDSTAPTVTISSPTSGSDTTSSSITVQYTGSDGTGSGVKTYWLRLDSGATINNSTNTSYVFSGYSNGNHTIYVWATDNLDYNGSEASVTFRKTGGGGGPVCGNGSCEAGENKNNCPSDCAPAGPVCGNASCETGEDCSTCSADCGVCPPADVCGDGQCTGSETTSTCPADCSLPIQTCAEQNGFICSAFETCSGTLLSATDSDACCSIPCESVPDLTISASASSVINDGSTGLVVVTVYNNAGETDASFTVKLKEKGTGPDKYSESKTVNGLGAGDAVSLVFNIAFNSSNPQMSGWLYQTKEFVLTADDSGAVAESNESNNETQVSIYFAGPEICNNNADDDGDGLVDEGCNLPNLYIKSIEIGSPTYVGTDLISVEFTVIVKSDYAKSEDFYVEFFKDALSGNGVAVTFIDAVSKDGELTLQFVWEAPIGTVFRLAEKEEGIAAYFQEATNFYVFVDSEGDISEVNEADNVEEIFIELLLSDLTLENVDIPSSVFSGENIMVSGMVKNPGDNASTPFTLSLYFNNELVDSGQFEALAIDSNAAFIFSVDSAAFEGENEVRVVVDPLDEVPESNESNNEILSITYVVDPALFYSYDEFLQNEPLWVSIWNSTASGQNNTYKYSVAGANLSVLQLISLSEFREDEVLLTSKLSSNLSSLSTNNLRIDRNNSLYSVHEFDVIERGLVPAYGQVNDVGVKWWTEPSFIRRMHYERINSLSLIWWTIWTENQ